MVPEIEARFCDADRTSPAVNDVLLVGDIMWIKEPLQIREVVIQTVAGQRVSAIRADRITAALSIDA